MCGISSQSGAHLFDKIRRLQQLLSGATVEVVGGQVSIREHPEAQVYCLNFLAKKLVVSLLLVLGLMKNIDLSLVLQVGVSSQHMYISL